MTPTSNTDGEHQDRSIQREIRRRSKPFSRPIDLLVWALLACLITAALLSLDRHLYPYESSSWIRNPGRRLYENAGWILTAYLTVGVALFATAIGGDRIISSDKVVSIRNAVALAATAMSASLIPLYFILAGYSVIYRNSFYFVAAITPLFFAAYILGVQAGRQFHLSREALREIDGRRLHLVRRLRSRSRIAARDISLSRTDATLGYILSVLFIGSIGITINAALGKSAGALADLVTGVVIPGFIALSQSAVLPLFANELWRRRSWFEHVMNHVVQLILWTFQAMIIVVILYSLSPHVGRMTFYLWIGCASTLTLPILSAIAVRCSNRQSVWRLARLALVNISLEPAVIDRASHYLTHERESLEKYQGALAEPRRSEALCVES